MICPRSTPTLRVRGGATAVTPSRRLRRARRIYRQWPPLPRYRHEAKGTQSLRVWWVSLTHLHGNNSLTSHRRFVYGSTPTTQQAVFMPGYIIAQGATYNVSCIIGSRAELVLATTSKKCANFILPMFQSISPPCLLKICQSGNQTYCVTTVIMLRIPLLLLCLEALLTAQKVESVERQASVSSVSWML